MKSTVFLYLVSMSGFVYGSESSIRVKGVLRTRSQDYTNSLQSIESNNGATELNEKLLKGEAVGVKPKKGAFKNNVKKSLLSKILNDKYNLDAKNHLRMSADSDTPEPKERVSSSESTFSNEVLHEMPSEVLKSKLLLKLHRNSF